MELTKVKNHGDFESEFRIHKYTKVKKLDSF
jgi:hypothetical protein